MIDPGLYDALQTRYIALHFTITFVEDTKMPVNKVSALRGGMGEMLLRANCIRDRDCANCDFESECIVRRTMYSKYEIKPEFVTTGESIGYVLECENDKENFAAGESMVFHLILFGKTIVYFNQFMQAFTVLGMQGIGKYHSRYRITAVRNTGNELLLDDDGIYMERYQVHRICDYVETGMQDKNRNRSHQLVFHTPLTLKYQNQFLQEYQMEPIVNAVKRRIYMLNCFEGKVCSLENYHPRVPQITSQEHCFVKVERYSSRQDSRMSLKGIKGWVQLEEISEELLPLLLAGELIHIGKNTSFGFGRYTVE